MSRFPVPQPQQLGPPAHSSSTKPGGKLKDFFLVQHVRYVRQPASPDAAKNDIGVSFSIGWSY
jgi:hypothetical protein